jgi:predicted lysophospholipase L1 biosynthesis ABC-type transport system permease subunit
MRAPLFERAIFRGARAGQTSVETMLVISVIVIAIVAAGHTFADRFISGMEVLADTAAKVYADPDASG